MQTISPNDPDPDFQSPNPNEIEIVCPRYKLIYEYLRITKRRLTRQEQRAFLYMLDVDSDVRYAHSDNPGECNCMEIFPAIIQALERDPVQAVVATRNLEGQSYPSRRFHTEKIGRFQGVVLTPKMQREHTAALRTLACRLLMDLETVIHELLCRPCPESAVARDMVATELQKMLELVKPIRSRKKTRRRR